jgi:hypothetical protein
MLSAFAQRLDEWKIAALLNSVTDRLAYATSEEGLIQLVKVSHIKPARARTLVHNGIDSLEALIDMPPGRLCEILKQSEASFIDLSCRNAARMKLLQNSYFRNVAKEIIEEAKDIVQRTSSQSPSLPEAVWEVPSDDETELDAELLATVDSQIEFGGLEGEALIALLDGLLMRSL